VKLAAKTAIVANAIIFDFDFFRTPILVSFEETTTRDPGARRFGHRQLAYSLFSRHSIKETEPE
jgi:hypothetical protein